MTDRGEIEREIRHLIATEKRATVLSNKLFSQGTGLFGLLAADAAERRVVSQSELFREAQARIRELQYKEAEALAKAVQILRTELPDTDFRVQLDTAPVPGAPAR